MLYQYEVSVRMKHQISYFLLIHTLA